MCRARNIVELRRARTTWSAPLGMYCGRWLQRETLDETASRSGSALVFRILDSRSLAVEQGTGTKEVLEERYRTLSKRLTYLSRREFELSPGAARRTLERWRRNNRKRGHSCNRELRHPRPPQPVVVLLGDFENLRALGILDDSGEKPELSLLSEHDPDMPWGEWVQGWYCGSPRAFLCVYWDAGKMWLGDAAGNHELHPSMNGEQLTFSVRGPRARFTFVGANGADLTYRYMRTGAQILERNSYPDHELPRWLVEGWHGERGYFTRELKNGKLFRVGGSDSRAPARGRG